MTQLPAPVQAAIDAANAGDIEKFLALFGPAGTVDDWGRTFTGPAEIRSWSDAEFIGKRVSLAVESAETSADAEVTVLAAVGGDGFNGPSHFTFRLGNDAITLMTIRA
jgi:SnoaL-like domain